MSETTKEEKIAAVAAEFTKSSKDLRLEQSTEIAEMLEVTLRRRMEDADYAVKAVQRKKRNVLDFSPSSTTAITKANSFDFDSIADKLNELNLELREAEIRHECAKRSYDEVFNKPIAE